MNPEILPQNHINQVKYPLLSQEDLRNNLNINKLKTSILDYAILYMCQKHFEKKSNIEYVSVPVERLRYYLRHFIQACPSREILFDITGPYYILPQENMIIPNYASSISDLMSQLATPNTNTIKSGIDFSDYIKKLNLSNAGTEPPILLQNLKFRTTNGEYLSLIENAGEALAGLEYKFNNRYFYASIADFANATTSFGDYKPGQEITIKDLNEQGRFPH